MKKKKILASMAVVCLLLIFVMNANAQGPSYTYLPIMFGLEPTPTVEPTAVPTEPTVEPTEPPTQPTEPPVYDMGNISIIGIFYDGTGQNEPNEYVTIKNIDTNPVQLQGWKLRDNYGWTFNFPSFQIQPNQECRIYTNEYHPESCGFSFGKSNGAIWNNTGDCAFLYNGSGGLVSQRCY